MVRIGAIVHCDELDQLLQVECPPDDPSLGVGLDDWLGVHDEVFDWVGEGWELEFIEDGSGDECCGVCWFYEFKTCEVLFVDLLLQFEGVEIAWLLFALPFVFSGPWG
jgi:hypothetical protein